MGPRAWRYVRVVVLTILILIVAYGVHKLFLADKPSVNNGREQIVVGMMAGYAPFMTINEAGEYEGFDVDVAYELSSRLNKKLEFKVMDLAELLFALSRKKIDILLSGLTMTPERARNIEMIHYHGGGQETLPVAFWGKAPEDIRTFGDIAQKGLRVVVESGSSWEDCAETMGLTNVVQFSRYQDMILEIKYGKSAAILFDPDIVNLYTSKFDQLKVVNLPLEGKFKVFGLGIGLSKSRPALRNQVAEVVEQMRRDGTLRKLEIKWGLQ
jgi:arginine transport system substrate-binding protein